MNLENQNQKQSFLSRFSGKTLNWKGKVALGVVGVGLFLVVLNFVAPGIGIKEAILGKSIVVDDSNIDNLTKTEKIELPTTDLSTKLSGTPEIRIAGYAWNGESGIIVANGGPLTTSGSLMEKAGVKLRIRRMDWVKDLRAAQVNFVAELDGGNPNPTNENSAHAVMLMGDGGPYYVATLQKELDDKFGKDKYHAEIVAPIGLSYGEDKLIGPASWKTDPKQMLGKLISVVAGDGDWVILVNYCYANGLKINPDFTTYDPNAVNIKSSANDDYMEAANELIASVKEGKTYPLKEIVNGKLTNRTVNIPVSGASTWTPGDKKIFDELSGYTDIVSTKEFNNQMATTLIFIKEWAVKNPSKVTKILEATYTASNQMKQYDEWRVRASQAVHKTFGIETPEYWYKMFQGQSGEKEGVKFNVGGTRAFTLADAKQYYGMGADGVNRYKSIYDQVSGYLTSLNPLDFNSSVDGIPTYDKMINTSYLSNVNIGMKESGATYKTDYTKEATNVVASRAWQFSFATGNADLLPSSDNDLDALFKLLNNAESTKVVIIGYTDSTGDPARNKDLSFSRANSVKDYLTRKGISGDRIQEIKGLGSENPVGDNNTVQGRASNRRTEVKLLN